MELLIIMCLVVALASLAPQYGHDSRARFESTEETYARRGWRW